MADASPFVLLLINVRGRGRDSQDFVSILSDSATAGTWARSHQYDILTRTLTASFSSTVDAVSSAGQECWASRPRRPSLAGRIAAECKRRDPSLLLFSSAHANAIPAETLDFRVRYVVQGDTSLLGGALPGAAGRRIEDDRERWQPVTAHGGIWFRSERGEPMHFAPRRAFGHLDEIPFPSRKKLANDLYDIGPLMNAGYRGLQLTKLAGSRGCPYACNFCSEGMEWPAYRARTPENIFKEIENAYPRDGARHFYFVDDTINVRTKDLSLCSMIVRAR
jgi:hypothetical protein